VSEIADKLDVSQPAIIRHLKILDRAGLIESYKEDNPLGAARKYYRICSSFNLEIALEPRNFRIKGNPRERECERFFEKREYLDGLARDINKATDIEVKASKAKEMLEEIEPLLSCGDYEPRDPVCIKCRTMAVLRSRVSEIVMHISRGEINLGLKTLSETITFLTKPENLL